MRTLRKYVSGFVIGAGLVLAPMMSVESADPVDPSTLTCSEFLTLSDEARGNDQASIIKKMQLTSVGYWVIGFMNGYVEAVGGDHVVWLRDRGAGSNVTHICAQTPDAMLSEVVAVAAELLAED